MISLSCVNVKCTLGLSALDNVLIDKVGRRKKESNSKSPRLALVRMKIFLYLNKKNTLWSKAIETVQSPCQAQYSSYQSLTFGLFYDNNAVVKCRLRTNTKMYFMLLCNVFK